MKPLRFRLILGGHVAALFLCAGALSPTSFAETLNASPGELPYFCSSPKGYVEKAICSDSKVSREAALLQGELEDAVQRAFEANKVTLVDRIKNANMVYENTLEAKCPDNAETAACVRKAQSLLSRQIGGLLIGEGLQSSAQFQAETEKLEADRAQQAAAERKAETSAPNSEPALPVRAKTEESLASAPGVVAPQAAPNRGSSSANSSAPQPAPAVAIAPPASGAAHLQAVLPFLLLLTIGFAIWYYRSLAKKRLGTSPAPDYRFEKRPLSAWLWIGLIGAPYIAAWFTLRKGHSTNVRVLAFGWTLFFVGIVVFKDPARQGASVEKDPTATFDLHAQNGFECNTDSMPANSNVAQISARFYRDGTALILSGEIRNDAEWEPHGAGLRYRSLKVANNAGGVLVENPTWFNIDRAVVLGKKGDKSLVRLEGYETLYCISEWR